jgi:reactive intermediate/imine deaminase
MNQLKKWIPCILSIISLVNYQEVKAQKEAVGQTSETKTVSTGLPFSDAVAANGMLYISGQIGLDPVTDQFPAAGFTAEADQVMKNLGKVLKDNGLGFSDLVSVTIYLKSMDNYTPVNKVYRQYFNGVFPARVCIAVQDLPLHANIEMAAIARQKVTLP